MQNSPKASQKAALIKPGGQFGFLFEGRMLRVSLKWRLCQKRDLFFESAFNLQEGTVLGAMVGAGALRAVTGHRSRLLTPFVFLIQPNVNLIPGEKQAAIITLN